MTQDDRSGLFDDLDILLEQEREMLVTGALEKIPEIMARKEALIDRLLELEGREEVDLGPLKGKVERNQALLDGALRGIRNVANRFATLRKIRQSLETYDAQGRKAALSTSTSTRLEKRA